jgi:predicted Rossmann fold flavoprotein
MIHYDVIVIGAGAAGMMAAIEAGRRGRKVLVLDHAHAPGEKIRISGGGRCNFTNTNTAPDRFISQNPRFAISALARYRPEHFIALVKSYGIAFHEKTLGQLFCDGSSKQIITLLTSELSKAGAILKLATTVDTVAKTETGFALSLSDSAVTCTSLVIACGGKSIPKMGATSFGYRLAEQFGLRLTETRPALVPLTFEPRILERTAPLAGISTNARVSCGKRGFDEALLFTHRGLSGPAVLQISSYRREGDDIAVNLLPDIDVPAALRRARAETPRLALSSVLAAHLPKRLAQLMADEICIPGPIGDFSNAKLGQAERTLTAWTLKPTGSEGYRTAEVTLGGVDTRDLDSTSMQARNVAGLFVIGEVVDVTGWLGGYNFQWAWASGWAAGQWA